jgi:hypothetical protein
MSSNTPISQRLTSPPIALVAGGVGVGLILAAAIVAYMRSQQTSQGRPARAGEGVPTLSWPPFRMKRRWVLTAAIKMIENDASRKVLLGVLKALAKRTL